MKIVYVCIVLSLISIIMAAVALSDKKEGFDAAGLVFNIPSEWFIKDNYNINDWYVYYEPDQLSKPECTHYRGNEKELNWLSSAYRFWRI